MIYKYKVNPVHPVKFFSTHQCGMPISQKTLADDPIMQLR